ncbi:insulin-2-like [Centropristis striata]|uniref:insulin-2-like n=1 Tax=Centropristis striata TaxID=184440 RepID=UPI0027DECA3D|nr:insulin-2-like [Centropristis striata]
MWLQSVSLLVLLVVSWPGSEAAPPPPQQQTLCGSHLVDALYLVCGERGFVYHPKRDVDSATGEDRVNGPPGLVRQCCHQPCSIFDLQNYCN